MFVPVPVKDQAGAIVAVLAFRLRPAKQFTRALESGLPGEVGATYAFDKNGLLHCIIGDSRPKDCGRKRRMRLPRSRIAFRRYSIR